VFRCVAVAVVYRTTIGYGAKKQGTEAVHGSPIGADDLKVIKTKFGFDPAKSFDVPAAVSAEYAAAVAHGETLVKDWNALVDGYCKAYPKEGADLRRRLSGQYPDGWEKLLPSYKPTDKADSTRKLSQAVLNAIVPAMTELVGGSADLTPSTFTDVKGGKDFQKDSRDGRYFRFGVREHAMVAFGNGVASHGGLIPYTSTFFNFIEYAFPAVRLSAISGHHQIYVMTHDSIGLGEDGPTHQPIEAMPLCRATPGLITVRPADGNEVSGAYKVALSDRTATVIALSRQNLPQVANTSIDGVAKGGYVVYGAEFKAPKVTLIGTGSELSVAVDAAKKLAPMEVRVVSMPSTSLFDRQPVEYRRATLPVGVRTVSVEALGTLGWEKYSHLQIGMNSYGASAPLAVRTLLHTEQSIAPAANADASRIADC
jgi:transketolase